MTLTSGTTMEKETTLVFRKRLSMETRVWAVQVWIMSQEKHMTLKGKRNSYSRSRSEKGSKSRNRTMSLK